jgi:hypothetical protein
MPIGATRVAERKPANRAAVRADPPVDVGNAKPLDPHFDRQGECGRHRDVFGRCLRLDREAFRAQSPNDDAAREERERIPGERDLVRRRVRVAAVPLDALQVHRVEQRSRRAFDRKRAAAARNQLANDEVDAGLAREEEDRSADDRSEQNAGGQKRARKSPAARRPGGAGGFGPRGAMVSHDRQKVSPTENWTRTWRTS